MGKTLKSVQNALKEYEQRQNAAAQGSSTSTMKSSIPGVQQALDEYSAKNQKTIDSDTYNRWKKATNNVSKWLEDRNNFFNETNKELNSGGSGFDAAEFFEMRKQQADALKQGTNAAMQDLEDNKDAFSYADYLDLHDWMSNFAAEADDVLSYYQQSSNAKQGMRAYEDEILAAMENQKKKQAVWDTFMPSMDSPTYGIMSLFRPSTDQSKRMITDQWTDDQRFQLGLMQMEDPKQAQKYARKVNRGEDPLQIAAQAQATQTARANMDLEAEQKEIDRLKAELDAYYWNTDFVAASQQSRAAFDAEFKRREQEIADRERELVLAKRVQDGIALQSVTGNDDFADKSVYVSTSRPGISEEDAVGGYTDAVYEYINGNENVKSYLRSTRKSMTETFDQLKPEETAIYNYYYATEGKEKAEEYLRSIEDTLNQRKGTEIASNLEDKTFRELMFAGIAGLDTAGNNTANLFNFSGDYKAPSAVAYAGQAVREDLEDVGPYLPEVLGGASLGQLGYDVISTTANMAPSLAVGAFSPNLGAALMGASAAGGAYQEALNDGYSKEQARLYSALVGASEAGMEKILGGFGEIGGELTKGITRKLVGGVENAIAKAALELGGSMISEGFEEGLQEVITPWIKNLTLMTDEDVNWEEVAYSTLLGALSVLPTEGPKSAVNAYRYSRDGSSSSGSMEGRVADLSVSEGERAIQMSTGNEVDVVSFARMKTDGHSEVKLADNSTADINDISFATETEAKRYATVASLPGIGTEVANEALTYLNENGGAEDTNSITGIRDAYYQGYYGRDLKTHGRESGLIDSKLAKTMYQFGQKQAAIEAEKSVTVSAKAKAEITPAEGFKKVVFEGNVKLDSRKEANVKIMDFIAENFSGNTVRVYESYKRGGKRYYKDNSGKERLAPNGMYQDNEIWVDLNAGNKGEGLSLNTFGHEMYHHIEKTNKKGAQELASFLLRELGEKTSIDIAIQKQIAKARRSGYGEAYFIKQGYTRQAAENAVYDRAMSDLVADSLEAVFTKGDPAAALAKLRSEDQGLFDQIKSFVDEWVTKLRKFLKSGTISEEGAIVANLESFEKIQQMFMEAMDVAGQNFKAAEVADEKSTTTDGDAQYSTRSEQRITMTMTDSERTAILKNKVIIAEVYRGQADQSIADKNENLISGKESLIKSALVKIGEEFKVFTDYNIADVKTDFRLSRGNIKESVSKEIDPITLAKLMPVFKTAVENAVGIERHANRYFFDNDTVSFENLLGGYVDGNNFVPIRFGLKHSKNGGATLYLIVDQNAVEIKKIKAEVAKDPAAQNGRPESSRSAFKVTISSIIPFVNSKDLLRYLPDNMLNEQQKEAKYDAIAETIAYTRDKNDRKYAEYIRKGNLSAAKQMVETAAVMAGYDNLFYHGSRKGGGFTRFREWSYFTENKGYAERYVQRENPDALYEVYAKMDKPFDTRDPDTKAIFENIRGEYGLSEIQDSGLPDWTDGYDISDYIDENGLDFDSIVLDEGGDMVDGKPVSRGLSYVIRNANQVKSADVITYDDNGRIIPISQRFNPENEDIRYSLRDSNQDNSVRGILSRIDVSTRKNSAEQFHLSRYQERLGKLSDAEERLTDIQARMAENPDKKELNRLKQQEHLTKSEISSLRKRLNEVEKTDLFKKMVAEQRLVEYRESQKAKWDEMAEEYRLIRKELTGADSVISVMEDEFVRLAKDLEDKKIDLNTMEAEFMRLFKEYDKQAKVAGQVKGLKEDNATWQREFKRLMNEYDIAGRKIQQLEATILRQRQRAKEKVQSRRNTEMRNKIIRRVGELEKMLLRGSKTSYVPEELRKPVSAILEAIDLRKSDKETKVAEHLRDLRLAYTDIKDSSDPALRSIYDEGLNDHLTTLTKIVGETKLGDMTSEQMDALYDIVTAVLKTVRNANEAFTEGKRQLVSEMSETAMREVQSIGGEKNRGKNEGRIVKALKQFIWNDMRPVDIFETIGSEKLRELFSGIRKGEDTWAKDIREAREFFRQQWQKFKGGDWDMEKEYTFRSASDMEFKLNTEQIMSIYALFRRDKGQAMDHLRKGGFVFDNSVVDKKGKTHSDATAYNLTDDTIMQIVGTLTKDQRQFVEAMQGYLSDTMGAKGNEVSMKLYGIKLFREKNYFPLRSAEQYMERAKANQRGEVKIKNSGFTKPVTPNANTAIVLSPFLSVWGSHVDEMSNYHAFVLPMEDMYRVYNYRTDVSSEESTTRSVQAAIQNAYGEGAVKAIDQLLKDINGGVRGDSTASVISQMISKYKKGATMASLSVAVQQPSAILRAAGMIDAQYFFGQKPSSKMVGRTWEEIKKYAPIATIKEIGSFDTNTGRTATQYLTGMEYNGFEEKLQAFFKDGEFRDEILGRLPAFMDEVSWSVIWNSVKREQAAKNPGMDTHSEAFMQKVADRFTDVIVHTQVYDSVLAKNAMMRSKDTGMKMITAFMAEPTVTANMVAGALLNWRRTGDKKTLVKTLSSIVAATVVNAAAASVVYALRDDDEDERLDEKWIASFRDNVLDSANPMGYIPLLRDVQNVMQGYDVERPDMSVVSDFADAMKSLTNEDLSGWEKTEKSVGAIMNAFGVPAKNVIRDAKGIVNTLRQAFGAKNVSTKTGRQMAWRGEKLDNGEQLLLAIQNGDTAHMERVASRFESMDKAMGSLMTAIRRQYVEGIMEADEAKELLMIYNELSEDDVYWKLQEWDYAKANGTSEGYTKMGDLMTAVASGEGLEEQIQRYRDNGMEDSDIRSQISKVYHEQYLEADESGRESIRQTVSNALRATGSTDTDIQDKFKGWDFEAEYGMTYGDMIDGYREGEVNRFQLRDAMAFYGLKNFEINEKLADLDGEIAFQNQFGMSLSQMKELYGEGDITRNQMVNALVYSGKSKNEAQEMVTQMDIEKRIGIAYSKLDDAYRAGDISRNTLYNAMLDNGATREEADEAIVGYDWLKRNAQGDRELTISDAKKFSVSIGEKAEYETLEDYGVSISAYKEYKAKVVLCKGVDANGDGKTDSGTLRDEILRMIDSLPISDSAKDGLALLRYSKSSIRKNAPWH